MYAKIFEILWDFSGMKNTTFQKFLRKFNPEVFSRSSSELSQMFQDFLLEFFSKVIRDFFHRIFRGLSENSSRNFSMSSSRSCSEIFLLDFSNTILFFYKIFSGVFCKSSTKDTTRNFFKTSSRSFFEYSSLRILSGVPLIFFFKVVIVKFSVL